MLVVCTKRRVWQTRQKGQVNCEEEKCFDSTQKIQGLGIGPILVHMKQSLAAILTEVMQKLKLAVLALGDAYVLKIRPRPDFQPVQKWVTVPRWPSKARRFQEEQ